MSGSQKIDLVWTPPGPIALAFMNSTAPIPFLNGPVGSGKTTTLFMKALKIAQAQQVSKTVRTTTGQGVRRVRATVVRDTYRQLWRSTIPSWLERMPKEVGTWHGSDGDPATHRIRYALADNTVVDLQVDFVAIGDAAVEEVLRGYETTFFLLNEADMSAREVFYYAMTRFGRFPPQSDGGASWSGIIADCNAPVLDSWLYDEVFVQTLAELAAKGIDLFRQPSGLSPLAENLSNLVPGYYQRQAAALPKYLVQRMIENRPGYSRSGRPVYDEFVDSIHAAAYDIEALAGLPMVIGLDAGGNPAAALSQPMPNGQIRLIDELVGEPGTGAMRFGEMLAKLLHDRYGHIRHIRGVADPSAAYGADKRAGEKNWMEIVEAKAGIRIKGAPTNKPSVRWEAVKVPLARLIDGQPGLVVSPRCKIIRAGFNANYRFRKVTGTERYHDEAEKNAASHVHDAVQYLCLDINGEMPAEIRNSAWRREVRQQPVQREWDPLA